MHYMGNPGPIRCNISDQPVVSPGLAQPRRKSGESVLQAMMVSWISGDGLVSFECESVAVEITGIYALRELSGWIYA